MTVPFTPAAMPPLPSAACEVLAGGAVFAALPLPTSATCANCLAPVTSNYCGECGAPRLEDRPLTVRRFVDDAWSELTSLDSAMMRTARSLVTRPGELTQAYLEGRTRWFLSPLRVFLACFALYLFSQSVFGDPTAQALRDAEQKMKGALPGAAAPAPAIATPAAPLASAASRTAQRIALKRELPNRFVTSVRESLHNPWFQLMIVAPWALVLAMLYRGRRWSYARHVVMALHLFAANALILVVNTALHAALGLPKSGIDAISVLQWLGIGTYFYLAARRVHNESVGRTAGKAVLFVAGAQVAMIAVPILAITVMLARFAVQLALVGR